MDRKLSGVYAEVYQALDASVASQTCLPRSEAVIQAALATFRSAKIDAEGRDCLITMSHQLQALQIATVAGDASGRASARQQLSACAERWLQRLPMH